MKKNFYFSICLLVLACKGFELQPDFISVFGIDEKTVQLEEYKQLEDNSVQLIFSDAVELQDVVVSNDGLQTICVIEKEILDGKEVHVVKLEKEVEIGAEYVVSGTVKSGVTTQEFCLNFKGKNTNPAGLELSEYKPMGKTKTVKEAEFVELIVTKAGNLSEFKLCSVGSKKNLDYIFPACEVSEGEIIVLHLYPANEVNTKENFTDELGNSIASDIETARDFYASLGKPSRRKTNVVLLENSDERIIDYLVHIYHKQIEDGCVVWDVDIKGYVNKLLASPFKEQFEKEINNPKIVNLTSTVCYAKSGGKWIKTKEITRGRKNGIVKEEKEK